MTREYVVDFRVVDPGSLTLIRADERCLHISLAGRRSSSQTQTVNGLDRPQ